MSTHLDPGQAIKGSYEEIPQAFKTLGVGGSLVPEQYDFISLTYVAAGSGSGEIETVTYAKDGIDFAMLTLTYNVQNKLATVTRSDI